MNNHKLQSGRPGSQSPTQAPQSRIRDVNQTQLKSRAGNIMAKKIFFE